MNNIADRDKLTKHLYAKLTEAAISGLKVVRKSVNTVQVLDGDIPIRTYTAVVIPIHVNLTALDSITGNVVFNLDETITNLTTTLQKLQQLQGTHFVGGRTGGTKKLEQALSGLA